jgi:hypothetical protein
MIDKDIFIYAPTWILSFWECELDMPQVEQFFANHRFYISSFLFISSFANYDISIYTLFSVCLFTEKLVATTPRDPHLVRSRCIYQLNPVHILRSIYMFNLNITQIFAFGSQVIPLFWVLQLNVYLEFEKC